MRLSRTAIFCFLAVYLIWGSTYLAIRIAVETIPVWLLITLRNMIAAPIMFGLSTLAREQRLNRSQIRIALMSGVFLFLSNGLVGFIEKSISSGVVAVVIGSMPIWIMIFGWAFFKHAKPAAIKVLGGVVGLSGVALIARDSFQSDSTGSALGMTLLFLSMWLWAFGTLIQRRASAVVSPFRFAATQMAAAILPTFLLSLATQESVSSFANVSTSSALALLYLIVFGSVIGFTAFSWLARNIDTQLVSTYALVNPVVAVVLGSLLYGEPVSGVFFVAIILIGVGLVLLIRPVKQHNS